MIENDVHMVWVQKQVIICWFVSFGVFVDKDLNFWTEYFSVVFMENNNKMTENNVQKIWVKNVVIWGWFLFLAGFRF